MQNKLMMKNGGVMNGLKILSVMVGVVFVSACSQFEPFVDARREAGQIETIGASRPNQPVVCSFYGVDPQTRLVLAEKECQKLGKVAKSQSVDLFNCRLLTPVKETFSCVEKE